MNKASATSKVIAVVLLAGVLPLLIATAAEFLFGTVPRPHYTLHECLEMAGSCIALGVALLLLLNARHEGGSPHLRWIVAGLLVMGLMDAADALAPSGGAWSWIRHVTILTGGAFFAMVWLPVPRVLRGWEEPTIAVIAGLTLAFVLSMNWWPEGSLTAFSAQGYHPAAELADVVGGLGFLASAAFFLRRYLRRLRTIDLFFGSHAMLFGSASLLITMSTVWAADWWVWHLARLVAYAIVLACAYRIVADLFQNATRQAVQLKQANDALQEENAERNRAEAALRKANETLEHHIAERTAELRREVAERTRVGDQLREAIERYELVSAGADTNS